MGVILHSMHSHFEFSKNGDLPEQPRQVLALAEKSIQPFIEEGFPSDLHHLIVATSCPDMLAPSVGQMINERFNDHFSNCQTIDMVQGCAGGVSAMILGSQLSEYTKSSALVIQVDAARKATSRSKSIHKIFGNGSFGCLIKYDTNGKGLIHYKTRQHKGLSEVVTIKLGHDSDAIIQEKEDMRSDPRKHLGLSLNNSLAMKLIREAEGFYIEFVKESKAPDVMILHQVNPHIISHLRSLFDKYNLTFIDVACLTGNCGAASVGIALERAKDTIRGKKVLLCSFGTGGVITAGLWQN